MREVRVSVVEGGVVAASALALSCLFGCPLGKVRAGRGALPTISECFTGSFLLFSLFVIFGAKSIGSSEC